MTENSWKLLRDAKGTATDEEVIQKEIEEQKRMRMEEIVSMRRELFKRQL